MLYALNSAILLHTSAKQYDAASQIYRRMCAVGPQPDTVTINTLLAACANAGRLSQALKLFDELRDRGASRFCGHGVVSYHICHPHPQTE